MRRGGAAALVGAGATAWGAAALADRRRIARDPARAALDAPLRGEVLRVAGAGGTDLHVELFGPRDAPPLVLVHGWTCALRFWKLQIQALSGEHRVIAYDQRGHGESAAPQHGDWSMETLGEDLERVLDATLAGRERAVIAGHSLGGMTIAAWARGRGGAADRARAAAFFNTGMGDLIAESLLLRTPDALASIRGAAGRAMLSASLPMPGRSSPLAHRAVHAIAFGPDAGAATVAFGEDMVLECRREVRAGTGRTLAALDLHDAVAHVDAPAIVLAGMHDRLTPPVHAKRLAGDLPQLLRYVAVERSGHMTPLERPGIVSDILAELSAAPAAVAA
ncbi:MAG: alpha/beta fold hydrolase [Actinobacteria bacterium]|nr:MAG: alpha/beta fold hydrolase [Actinomycetota bacterium]